MKHIVLSNPSLNGFEYGMLRDFEDEVVRITGASRVDMPSRSLPRFIDRRIAHGTRYSPLRGVIPRATCRLEADVAWVILMGPENFTLDLFRDWGKHIGVKILYLFDTMEIHLRSVRRVLSSTKWDLVLTSFEGAKPFLEHHTQRKWLVVPQGVKLDRFTPAPTEKRLIDFCSYGRRLENVHESLNAYCAATGKHYDYTTAAALQPQLDPRENYGIYAWHIGHSTFNVCWPVELTSPRRVKTFSPITCRWFEAAAGGSVVIGAAPADPTFETLFGRDFVTPIPYDETPEALTRIWEALWQDRARHVERAAERRERFANKWSWESRVFEIADLLERELSAKKGQPAASLPATAP